jgi:succinate-semialdehyde dehydrogenase/glutarate-semialdehyde dehydrogenase
LNASVWGPKASALAVAHRLNSGSVGIRSSLQIYGSFDTPMGGFKSSGLGHRHGAPGIQRFSQSQSIVTGPSAMGGYDALLGNLQTPWAASLVRRSLQLWRHIPWIR